MFRNTTIVQFRRVLQKVCLHRPKLSIRSVNTLLNEQDSGCVSLNDSQQQYDEPDDESNEKRNQEQTWSCCNNNNNNDDHLESGSNFLWVGLANEEPIVHRDRRPKNHDRLSKKSQRHSAPPGSLEQFKSVPPPPLPPSNRRKTTANVSGKTTNLGQKNTKSQYIITMIIFKK